jgi:hypothetical protein
MRGVRVGKRHFGGSLALHDDFVTGTVKQRCGRKVESRWAKKVERCFGKEQLTV